jgi:hypothetical protein
MAEDLDFILSTELGAGIASARLRAGNYDIKDLMGWEAGKE